MAHLLSDKIGTEVCKAIGLDTENIKELNLYLKAGSVAYIEIIRYLDGKELPKVKRVLERYEFAQVKA